MAIVAKFTRTLPAPTATISGGFVFLLSAAWFTQADQGSAGSPISGGTNSILNGGSDMQIFSSPGATNSDPPTGRLPIEVVTFVTGGTPQAEVWVMTSSYSSGDTITVGKDDTQISQPAVGAPFGRNAARSIDGNAWNLSEGFSTVFIDSTGNSDATSTGVGVSSVAGINSSLATRSVGAGVISSGVNVNSTNMGMDFWANFDQVGTVDTLLGVTGNPSRIYLGIRSGGASGFLGAGAGNSFIFNSTNSVPLTFPSGTYVKMSLVLDNGTARVYVNGIEEHTFSYSFSGVNSSDFELLGLGGSGGVFNLTGNVQYVRINNAIRSPACILSEYVNQNDPDNFGTSSEWVLLSTAPTFSPYWASQSNAIVNCF